MRSRIVKATRPTFAAMVVIVDARQIDRFNLGNPSVESQARDDSILSMFDRVCPNGATFELTGRDRAFLAGLYHARST